MHFHVSFTSFKKDPHLPLSVLYRVFARPTPRVDVVIEPPRLLSKRAYGVARLPSSSFRHLGASQSNGYRSALARVDFPKDEHDRDADDLIFPREQEPLTSVTSHIKGSSDRRTTKPTPPSHVMRPMIPRTQWELYQEILRLLSLDPPAPFSRLMSVHQRQPVLQSVESYNLLLQLSIRHNFSRHTRLLVKSMALNKIEPNVNTEKLVVRYLVARGEWMHAWQQTITRYPLMTDIPVPVILELLAPGTRNIPQRNTYPSHRLPHSRVESRLYPRSFDGPHERPERGKRPFKVPLDTLILLLRRFPQLSMDELAGLPPRVVSYVVRGLLRNGHPEDAVALTEKHLKSLPPKISPRQIKFSRDLVHLHLSSEEVKLANYKKRRRLVEHLFSLHPNLYPDSQTVFLLMRYMKASKRCGIEAYLFYKDYKARWGVAVEGPEVRRRIVAYAIKQRKLGIAKEISLEGPLEDHPPPQKVVRSTFDRLLRVREWSKMYPRKGRNSRLWRRLLIRMLGRRRAMEKARRRFKRR